MRVHSPYLPVIEMALKQHTDRPFQRFLSSIGQEFVTGRTELGGPVLPYSCDRPVACMRARRRSSGAVEMGIAVLVSSSRNDSGWPCQQHSGGGEVEHLRTTRVMNQKNHPRTVLAVQSDVLFMLMTSST
jgi:hypothetical protein